MIIKSITAMMNPVITIFAFYASVFISFHGSTDHCYWRSYTDRYKMLIASNFRMSMSLVDLEPVISSYCTKSYNNYYYMSGFIININFIAVPGITGSRLSVKHSGFSTCNTRGRTRPLWVNEGRIVFRFHCARPEMM